jgi:hypothetical protein
MMSAALDWSSGVIFRPHIGTAKLRLARQPFDSPEYLFELKQDVVAALAMVTTLNDLNLKFHMSIKQNAKNWERCAKRCYTNTISGVKLIRKY